MHFKHFINWNGEFLLACKYNPESKRATVGGSASLSGAMQTLIADYFKVRSPVPIRVLRGGKVRYDFHLCWTAFQSGLARLRENGMIENVKQLGRVMR